MPSRLQTKLKTLFRRPERREDPAEAAPSFGDDHLVARTLCESIDRAVHLGQWAHAVRLAATAGRLGPKHPRLTERLARLKLARRRPDEALCVVEACRVRSVSLRLLRAVCLLQVGRIGEAHLELNAWSRAASAPADARLLAALLDWRSGDDDDAIATLMRNVRVADDPDTLALLLLLSTEQGRGEQALMWARRLRDATAFGPRRREVAALLHSLGLHETARTRRPTADQVATLAMEVSACEEVIPALVEAQHRRLEPAVADLLRGAIERARPDLIDETPACEGLARLALLRGEPEAARHWARRALQLQPLSATARRLLAESEERLAPPDGTPGVIATIGEPARGRAA